MAFDGSRDVLETDFQVLEAIGAHVDRLMQIIVKSGAPGKTIRRWLAGRQDVPEDVQWTMVLVATATDLELFTPSTSGATPVDRYLGSRRPESEVDRGALEALRRARFRLVRIVGRDGADLVRLRDLVTDEALVLLDSRIAPSAAGATTAMRLCPLASGRQTLITPLFAIDAPTLARAMTFVRYGKLLGGGQRCAANLYRDIARGAYLPMPTLSGAFKAMEAGLEADLSEVQRLYLKWLRASREGGPAGLAAETSLAAETRTAASLRNLVDALNGFAIAVNGGPDDSKLIFARISEIQIETLAQRARAGVAGYAGVLDRAAEAISHHITRGDMGAEARSLFERLRARYDFADPPAPETKGAADRAAMDRVIQLIQALRAKTVDRGCTEEEAMAAAAKVAELLARHDLSLDELGVRQSDCAGAPVETGRRRRAAQDYCVQPVAEFCDCRAWSEESTDGTLRYVFFGLEADVEAARFLHDLIENVFETESAAFRQGAIYGALRGGERRTALNSFQIGLSNGIAGKLNTLKAARSATAAATTGRDLVAVKQSVVDDELEKLGLHFTRRSASSRRLVNSEAYAAGRAAGALFEPHAPLTT